MASTVRHWTNVLTLDGRKYRRISHEYGGEPASRKHWYQVATATKHWRDLAPRCVKIRARIDAALDNPQTSD